MFFSLIVPIYNRPDEARELLESLSLQTCGGGDFELVLVEDGSLRPCADEVEKFRSKININYIVKENSGRSDTRNAGMKNAGGDYFIFFDSDCIIPPRYLETVRRMLDADYADCFGGPDREHPSFSVMQKAINYAMTSFWTTGGIRGGKVNMEKFKPRTFNMGFSRAVYETVGGFKDMYGEDIDLSIRIGRAGFTTKLYRDAFVYHKRRVDLKRFYRQVHVFGQARIDLYRLYPDSLKPVHTLPALFVLGSIAAILSAVFVSWRIAALPAIYVLLLFFDSLIKTRSVRIAALSIVTSFIQIFGYGLGFIRSFIREIIFRKGPEDPEIIRKIYR
ncbi:MAG: glycosyltransferase [Tannerella sp.]|jgi:glycosyltransferase involved in cell wall biosynthesis|nr:glycosyltransferase [Tannerella sp.]